MKKIIILFLLLASCLTTAEAQYKARGIKGGLAMGWQQWNGFQRQVLVGYQGGFLLEQVNANATSFFAELGYHLRGSAVRVQFFDINSGNFFQSTQRLRFHNVGVIVGGKKRQQLDNNMETYYMLGARAEYTVADSIDLYANMSNYIRRINYGVTVGGGLEIPIGKANELFFELTINPDFSQQVYMPPGVYYNRYTRQSQQVSEQRVINISLELSVGYKFLKPLYYE